MVKKSMQSNLKNFFMNIQQVFMTSNQIPLIDLVNTPIYAMDSKKENAILIDADKNLNMKKLKVEKNSKNNELIISDTTPVSHILKIKSMR